MNRLPTLLFLSLTLLTLSACSGGGGGGNDGNANPGGGDTGGPTTGRDDSGINGVWHAKASVVKDGCNERISDVRQSFTVNSVDDTVNVDDSLVTLTGLKTADGFHVGFTGVSGSCARDYDAQFSAMTDTTAAVHFVVRSTCGASVCENEWSGTATRDAAAREDEALKPKVTGTNCVPPVPQIGYRPSTFECFGNASVLARGFIRSAYSIVVRRIGQYNDRDPRNTGCSSARCSPYKTQQKIELPEYQVNCLGDSGFSSLYNEVTRISVKFSAAVEDSLDPQQFQQYCLESKKRDLN